MNRENLNPKLLKATKNHPVVLGLCLALMVGTAIAQTAPTLSERLRSVANYYGDSQGRIPVNLETGEVLYFSTASGRAPLSIYAAGATVAENATLAACDIDVAGQPVSCDPAYGHALIYGLEDLQSAQPDPLELKINCQHLFGSTYECKVTWLSGSASCYTCSGGRCAKTNC